MEQQVLITKELRLRITELEYENLPPEAYIREIQRIYIEETGKALPVKVEIYKSSESTKIDSESEYSGRAIRFYSEEDNIDEMYIVSEGTQGLKDWLYNVEALVAGKAYGQIDDVNNFTQEALTYFGYSYDSKDENYGIPIVGLGHSQAHNTNASSYLIHDTFTQVYGVNSAQLNYYQLFFADQEFQIDLINKYPILLDDELEIYELDTDVLKQHAMDFYEDKADNIVQELSIQDPLYAVQNFPGFFPLGEVNEYETNKAVPGLKESFDKIPESYLQLLQGLAIVYTLGVEQGNQLQVIDELLGIDSEFLFNFEKYQYVTQNRKISETIQSLDDNLPDVLDTIYKITNNSDSILTELEKTGYITSAQKIEMVETFSNIEKHLLSIEKSVSYMMMARGLPFSNKKAMEVAIDLSSYNEIVKEFDSIKKEIKDLQDSDELKDLVKFIGEGHGITELLESLHLESDVDGQKYIGSDFYLKSTEGSEEIWVSLTATGKMCGLGKLNLTKKEEMVETFKKALEEKVYEVFEFQRLRARVAIDYMESNPNIDRKFLHPHGFSESFNRTITRMNVHEEIPRFEDTTLDMTQQITNLNTSIEKGYLLIEQFRDSIEKLFSEEAKIAEKIDFLEEVYNGD